MTYRSRGAPRRASKCHVLVMAKAPVPGKVKTRLCPPLTPTDAAGVAEAALADTLDAVAGTRADRRILALEGEPGDWLPPGFEVIPQRGTTLDDRLALAWADARGPGLQIGMDTPHVTAALLDHCLDATFGGAPTASLGRAADGGWWAVGLADRWDIDVFTGVEMSAPNTATIQLARLVEVGHAVAELPMLTDVDRIEDALLVSGQAPGSRFAAVIDQLVSEFRGVA